MDDFMIEALEWVDYEIERTKKSAVSVTSHDPFKHGSLCGEYKALERFKQWARNSSEFKRRNDPLKIEGEDD